jgi:hypothetical protein
MSRYCWGRAATTNTTMPVEATAYAEINAAAITADHCAIGSNTAAAVNTTKNRQLRLVHGPSQCTRPASIQLPGGGGIGSDHETSTSYHKYREN